MVKKIKSDLRTYTNFLLFVSVIYNFFGTHDRDEFDKQCLQLILGDQVCILEECEGKLVLP